MSEKFTNLLPLSRQRANIHEYYIRLGVTIVLALSALVLAAAILLVPTYVFLSSSANTKVARLADLKAEHALDETEISARLDALAQNAATLTAVSKRPYASSSISSVLSVSRPGIKLSGFGYALGSGENRSTLAISGVATTREALRGYQLTLQRAPFVLSAALPVSAYAKDSNISFTITITLAP